VISFVCGTLDGVFRIGFLFAEKVFLGMHLWRTKEPKSTGVSIGLVRT